MKCTMKLCPESLQSSNSCLVPQFSQTLLRLLHEDADDNVMFNTQLFEHFLPRQQWIKTNLQIDSRSELLCNETKNKKKKVKRGLGYQSRSSPRRSTSCQVRV